jgi:hypothetical protein
MNINCDYCNKKFKNSYILKNHMKTAKYCLEIQGFKSKCSFKCNFCLKNYSQKKDLDIHISKCFEKKLSDKDKIITDLKLEKDKIILEKEARIKELQDQLVDIIRTRPPTTIIHNNNNNQRINTIINNLQPITEEHLNEQAQFLTLDHIKQGVDGYVKYALEYPFKDRIVCVDYSRKKIKYKDQDENIIEDPEMTKLSQKFFKAIERKNTEIVESQLSDLYQKLEELHNDSNDDMNEDETVIFQNNSDRITNKIFSFRDNRLDIMEASKGKKSDIKNNFVKNICSQVKV